jgi:NAD(P)-dependent dehydrogenase (short-subunit alcohol dehydrogenase family)
MAADAKRLLLGRAAEPKEIAATAIHLALDATAMTGSAVTADLGYTAR